MPRYLASSHHRSRLGARLSWVVGFLLSALLAGAQEAPALLNVSTRASVGTGADVLIAGIFIDGTAPRTILFRALGPTLTQSNVTGILANPQIRLYSRNEEIAFNDNWQDDPTSAATAAAHNLTPGSPTEALVVRTLAPGPYTAIVSGVNETTGVALVEAYDLDTAASTAPSFSRVLNLATRGRVGAGDVLIAGFVLWGSEPRNVLINAIAGSLVESGLNDVLPDSTLELRDRTGNLVAEADDWVDSPDFESIARTGASPRDPLEASMWVRLNPGPYTAIVRGAGGAEGLAIPEIYEFRSLNDSIRFSETTLADRNATLSFAIGSTAQSVDISFTGTDVARVGTGGVGTYRYVRTDNFTAGIRVEASGYTIVGDLQFYRTGVAVFSGKIQRPSAANEDAGGVLVLK